MDQQAPFQEQKHLVQLLEHLCLCLDPFLDLFREYHGLE
jgi:hypothetical protein